MSKRGSPIAVAHDVKQAKHEEQLSEMHSALHSLGDKAREPYPMSGEKMLPKKLRSKKSGEARAAKKHINKLHSAMMGCKE